ncbi:unnamed protein product [Caenorhabditis nigoni]
MKQEFQSPMMDGSGRRLSLFHGSEMSSPESPTTTAQPRRANPATMTSNTVGNPETSTVCKNLEATIKNNEIDIFAAGSAIHRGYAMQDATVADQVQAFIKKNAHKVSSSIMPPVTPTIDPDYFYVMLHGYGLVSQIALANSNRNSTKTTAEAMDLGKITGALCNIDQDKDRYYPEEAPFNGEKIEPKLEMPRKMDSEPHIVTKKLIFTLLSRSCSDPTDLKSIAWSIPKDASTTRSSNPRPFPRSLYDDIQDIVLENLNLDDELLGKSVYDEESCQNLKCLRGIADHGARKKRYGVLHRARTKLLTTTYHFQFKAALNDIKTSLYIPPPTGQRFGTFKLASHAKRPRLTDEQQQ